ncbi:hypothetical protein ABW21_db0200970 [Orbilia brochopaga]|nr:hypothetical protein ABW21_db0200970 [Drechslerella brochopaga]
MRGAATQPKSCQPEGPSRNLEDIDISNPPNPSMKNPTSNAPQAPTRSASSEWLRRRSFVSWLRLPVVTGDGRLRLLNILSRGGEDYFDYGGDRYLIERAYGYVLI